MNIMIEVFNKQRYDCDWPPRGAVEFIAWFEEKINSIPEEFRRAAIVDLGAVESYDNSYYATIEIYYCRPETKEEERIRADKEQEYAKSLREKELKQLKELKRKYGA